MSAKERERWLGTMVKRLPSEAQGTDRADWETDVYVVALVKAELKPNQFYRSAEHMEAKHGKPAGENAYGNPFWEIDGKKEYPSFPEDAEQYNLTFEVLEGDKKSDWLFAFASPRIWPKGDGSWGGKLAAIYLAADPAFKLHEGYEDDLSDLMGKPLRASVEPKPGNAQYAKVLAWAPLKKGEKYSAPKPAEPVDISGEDIPF